MSKLLAKLQRISRGASQPLGFRPAATPKEPPVVLIAAVKEAEAKAVAVEGADAVLISQVKLKGESLAQTVDSLAEIPWGVSVEEVTAPELSKLKEMGCDFLVFDAVRAPLMLLREQEMAKILKVESSVADGLARAIEQLPIDAVLIGAEGEPSLSIHRLMVCQHLANLVRKPLLTLAPIAIGSEDLDELLQAGIAGIVVNLERGVKEELSQLRQAIDALPASGRRKRRAEALLPYAREEEIIEPEEED